MNVRELIVALSRFPEKAKVQIECYDEMDEVVQVFEEDGDVYISNAEDAEDEE